MKNPGRQFRERRGLILSAYRSDTEPWRLVRLAKVAASLARKNVDLSRVARLHDAKGTLSVVWQGGQGEEVSPPLASEVQAVRRAWEEQNENGDTVRHTYGGPSAPPEVFPDYNYFDERELLKRGKRDKRREVTEWFVSTGVPRENLPEIPTWEAF